MIAPGKLSGVAKVGPFAQLETSDAVSDPTYSTEPGCDNGLFFRRPENSAMAHKTRKKIRSRIAVSEMSRNIAHNRCTNSWIN